MKPPPFTYHRPASLESALDLLCSLPPDVKVLAGGQSLVPLLNLRLARPAHVVDLNALAGELAGIDTVEGRLQLGALVRHQQLLTEPQVSEHAPLLVEAARFIGHRAIRTRGTVGGSLAHADPAAELPAVALVTQSELVVRGPAGERVIAAAEFFEGHFTTALQDDELLVRWQMPVVGAGHRWGFAELARRHGDFALVLVAAALELDDEATVRACRIAAGAVAPTPVLLIEAAEMLVGRRLEPALVSEAARSAADGCRPSGDVHASADYRRAMVEVLVRRALTQAMEPQVGGPRRATKPAYLARRPRLPELLDASGPVVTPLRVNGHPAAIAVPARRTLADALRDELGLTGTHLGCEHGVCGACTVLFDGWAVRSCLMLAVQAEGHDITTIEGVASSAPRASADSAPGAATGSGPLTARAGGLAAAAAGQLHPVQRAFRDHHGLQCGFCTPGMVLATLDLLARNPDPTEGEVREELAGNVCRCTGYVKVVESVLAAARALSDADREPPPGR